MGHSFFLTSTTATSAEEEDDKNDHSGYKEEKEKHLHSVLNGNKAGHFPIQVTPARDLVRVSVERRILPSVLTGTLVPPHISVGAGVVVPPPGLQAGVGAVLTGVLQTVLVQQQGEDTEVLSRATEPQGGGSQVQGVFVITPERAIIPAGVLTLPPQPVVVTVLGGVQRTPWPGPLSSATVKVSLALQD